MSKMLFIPLFATLIPHDNGAGNDNDALVPELWAQEALIQLESNLVTTNLVYRDQESRIQEFGDVINVDRPARQDFHRKTDTDEVTDNDAVLGKVQIPLNQHLYASFIIKDGERSKSFQDLVARHLPQAINAIARGLDQITLSNRFAFEGKHIGTLTTALSYEDIVAVDTLFNTNLAPMEDRNVIVSAAQKGQLLNIKDFVNADKLGDNGTAMRRASIAGGIFGADYWMSQNLPTTAATTVGATRLVNNAAGYPVGTTTLTVDGASGTVAVGQQALIAGQVYRLQAGSGPTTLVLDRGLETAVADNDVITMAGSILVNNVGGYAAGYIDTIAYDNAPTEGIAFGHSLYDAASGNVYSMLQQLNLAAGSTLLNVPLAASLADNQQLFLNHGGNYGWAFQRNAVATITRPLAPVMGGVGAVGAMLNYNGYNIRITITYDGKKQGHRVVVDTLAGTKVLDDRLGFNVLSN